MDRAAATDLIERTADAAGSVAVTVLETAIERAGDVVENATDVVQRAISGGRPPVRRPAILVFGAIAVLAVVAVAVGRVARRRRAEQAVDHDQTVPQRRIAAA